MKLVFGFFFLFFLSGFSAQAKHKKLKPGHWHTEFQLNDNTSLPVTFLIDKEKQLTHLYIINADEYIELTEVSSKGDSIFISFSTFDSELRAKVIKKDYITGEWLNHSRKGRYSIPFWSRNNSAPRFNRLEKQIDVFGKWEVTFDYDSEPEKALGVFEVVTHGCNYINSEIVKGTFLTETGDYRYLSGTVSSDSLYLSTFDGSHAFLFKSKMVDDTLWGVFYSGTHYTSLWYGVRNENFELTNPDSLTFLVNEEPISFDLPNIDGGTFSYPADSPKDQVTLIQIMGTWCPNCLDESVYLSELRKKHQDDLNIISVTYETQTTPEDKIKKVDKYRTVLNLDWTFLIGGDACKNCAGEMFPMLNEIISFPTLIFIDKNGKIRRIHTGFNGPGTGSYYNEFVLETNEFVKQLIEE